MSKEADFLRQSEQELAKLPQLEIRTRLKTLRQKHHDLDKSIALLLEEKQVNVLEARRLKKKKLFIKDQITQLENYLLPDIIA